MLNRIRSLFPHKLKYRLFAAFVLVILLPFGILNLYNYQRIETLVQEKISQQSHSQLEQMYRTLEDQLSVAFKTLIFLEQDSTVASVLTHPGSGRDSKTKPDGGKVQNLNNSFSCIIRRSTSRFSIFMVTLTPHILPGRPSITESCGTTLALIGNRWRACRIIGFRAMRTTCCGISRRVLTCCHCTHTWKLHATSRTAWPGSASITPSGFNRY